MKRQQFWQACQVGATYIGTVVGAGFASGQEVYQFFGRFGNWGYVAILLSTFMFYYLGHRLMILGSRLGAHSYRDLNTFLFGERVGRIVNTALLVMLFGVTVAMLAGAGELFRERLHLSFQIGALLTIVFTYFTVIHGMSGILKANLIIVPVMITFVLIAAWKTWSEHGWTRVWHTGHLLSQGHPVLAGLSGVIYVSFNAGLASGVLVPLGASIRNMPALRRGAELGAAGLGMMLLAVVFTLFGYSPGSLLYSVPMAFVATKLGPILQWLFVLVLWAEIFSTLVGNVYALGTQWNVSSPLLHRVYLAVLLLLAYVCSQIGFAPLVKYAYTLFGIVSLLIVLALLWPRDKLPEL